jgi:hypothetical protein
MASSDTADSDSERLWAEKSSRNLLEQLGDRWRHTLGVVERARIVGGALEPDEANVLIAAAYLHDVGYASALVQTAFHCVDGARFVRNGGHERLAGLVAYHSGASAEAEERGLAAALAEFEDERSPVSRALTYCDLTTDREGRPVEPEERLAEIRRRYGTTAVETRALARSQAELMGDVRAVDALLAKRGIGAMAVTAHPVRSG